MTLNWISEIKHYKFKNKIKIIQFILIFLNTVALNNRRGFAA